MAPALLMRVSGTGNALPNCACRDQGDGAPRRRTARRPPAVRACGVGAGPERRRERGAARRTQRPPYQAAPADQARAAAAQIQHDDRHAVAGHRTGLGAIDRPGLRSSAPAHRTARGIESHVQVGDPS
jgi:hypothetical protein